MRKETDDLSILKSYDVLRKTTRDEKIVGRW
jgi:hypothetical protein